MIWKAEFATGIRNIDHQHKQIVEIVTRYEELSAGVANWHEVHPLIVRTREFMQFHFCVEESLMRLLPYTDRDAHRAEHQRQLRQIEDIERQVLRRSLHTMLGPLMRDCLGGHLVSADKRLAEFALGLFGQRSPRRRKDGAANRVVRCE